MTPKDSPEELGKDSSAGWWEVKVTGGGFLCKTFFGGEAEDEETFLAPLGMTAVITALGMKGLVLCQWGETRETQWLPRKVAAVLRPYVKRGGDCGEVRARARYAVPPREKGRSAHSG
jgi:hypothetical protein